MIKSMTGYGRGIFENDGRNYKVEIKTINHKYTDTNIKMPRQITFYHIYYLPTFPIN